MRRLFLKGLLADEMQIQGADAHHLMHVMRAKMGQKLVVVDDHGAVAETEIIGFSAEAVTLRLLQLLDADTEPPVELLLAQCLPKADKMDLIVQKAVELGATGIIPLKSTNCVVKYDEKKAAVRQMKWQKVADEAAKQCARTVIPFVEPVQPLRDWLQLLADREPDTVVLLCYENEQQQEIKTYLQAALAKRYIVLIGPEGGFTLEEAELAAACGVQTVTLGPRILRAETAAIAALTIVQYEKGDLGGRSKK